MTIKLVAGKNVYNEAMYTTNSGGSNFLIGWATDAVSGAGLQGTTIQIPGVGNFEADIGGYYDIGGIPEGTYTITFSLAGYQTAVKTGVQFYGSGEDTWLDVQLLPL